MKNIFKLAAVAVVAISLNACYGCDAPKFNAKEYAKNKTERLDKLVELTDAQEKEIYNLYLAQGKEMKKNMAAAKRACGDLKCPDGKKAECGKPCPPKPECTKACDKKVECKKAECTKPCDKKAECKKAECTKPCDKKAECTKPCAKKAECKKAECTKPCAKKAECGKPRNPNFPRHEFVSPETKKANFEKIRSILTEEQSAKLKAHFAKRKQCALKVKECVPTAAPCAK